MVFHFKPNVTEITDVMRPSTEISHGCHVTTARVAMELSEKSFS